MTTFLKKICLFAVVAITATSNLFAGLYVVSNTGDSGNGSLRQAILNANAHHGGTITFFRVKGVITLQSPLPAVTNNTFILGPGKNVLTISGAGQFGIFTFGARATGLISRLTIADGFTMSFLRVAYASGINNSGRLLVEDCVVSNCLNFGTAGGAVFNGGQMDLNNCLIIHSGSLGPSSQVEGGALFNSGHLAMQSCIISNCLASRGGGILNEGTAALWRCAISSCKNDFNEGDGGGIYHVAGNLALNDCVISNCSAGFEGGGMAAFANAEFSRTVVVDNNALQGGGLYFEGGTNHLIDCSISSNEDFGFGGGGIKNVSTLAIDRSTVNGNNSSIGGGGIQNLGQLSMTNSTISGNFCFAPGSAGILNGTNDFDGDTFSNINCQITDCTLASNNATSSGGIGGIENGGGIVSVRASILSGNVPADFSGPLNSQGFNLILDTNGCALLGDCTGNIYGKDPLLGPLQNNGGVTMTEALLAGSPAIASGPINSPPHIDQRGAPRHRGSPQDIGAFQGVKPHTHFVSLTRVNSGVQIGLFGAPGLKYLIQRADSPAGPWTTLTTVTADSHGNGGCVDSAPGPSKAFYRSVQQ